MKKLFEAVALPVINGCVIICVGWVITICIAWGIEASIKNSTPAAPTFDPAFKVVDQHRNSNNSN